MKIRGPRSATRRGARELRSADFQSAVSPTLSRLCGRPPLTGRRLQTCDTADCKSALRKLPRLAQTSVRVMLMLLAALPLQAATRSESEDEILKFSPPHAELPPTFWEQYGLWVVIAAGVLLVLVGALVWWVLRPMPAIPVPIEILSRKELEALHQRSEDGQVLSQISRVLRRYLAGAFELPADELTTSEFCRAIFAHEKVGPDLATRAGDFLRQCDELKFALGGPPLPIGAAARAMELVELGEARREHLQAARAQTASK